MSGGGRDLPGHGLEVALFQPEIAPNTGNIGRLCVATGTRLHLVRPLGFVLSDRNLKRSGMDYWERLRLTVHDDDEAFFRAVGDRRAWAFSSKGTRDLWEAEFEDGELLIFGNETHGLSEVVRGRYPDRAVRIPQAMGERCLNLSTAVGIGLYEALRQVVGRIPSPHNPLHR
jgi:tRNA (cytidine/uridine-2'-O-)-methyltransferase